MLGQPAFSSPERLCAKQIGAFIPGQPFAAKQAGGAAAKGDRFTSPGCRGAA